MGHVGYVVYEFEGFLWFGLAAFVPAVVLPFVPEAPDRHPLLRVLGHLWPGYPDGYDLAERLLACGRVPLFDDVQEPDFPLWGTLGRISFQDPLPCMVELVSCGTVDGDAETGSPKPLSMMMWVMSAEAASSDSALSPGSGPCSRVSCP